VERGKVKGEGHDQIKWSKKADTYMIAPLESHLVLTSFDLHCT